MDVIELNKSPPRHAFCWLRLFAEPQDNDEVGRFLTSLGEEVDPELAQKAWQIYMQVLEVKLS